MNFHSFFLSEEGPETWFQEVAFICSRGLRKKERCLKVKRLKGFKVIKTVSEGAGSKFINYPHF